MALFNWSYDTVEILPGVEPAPKASVVVCMSLLVIHVCDRVRLRGSFAAVTRPEESIEYVEALPLPFVTVVTPAPYACALEARIVVGALTEARLMDARRCVAS
jgi:hypothetical protein